MVYADGQTNDWELHHKSGDLRNEMDEDEKCIYLRCLNLVHFEVVANVVDYPEEISMQILVDFIIAFSIGLKVF